MNDSEKYMNELEDAPFLRKLKATQGNPAPPDGYFSKLQQQLQAQIEDEQFLATEAPHLHAYRDQLAPDSPPAGYFETLPQRVSAKIRQENARSGEVRPLFQRTSFLQMRYGLGIAAAIALLIFIGIRQVSPTIPPAEMALSISDSLDLLSTDDLLAALDYESMESEEWASLLSAGEEEEFFSLDPPILQDPAVQELLEEIDWSEVDLEELMN